MSRAYNFSLINPATKCTHIDCSANNQFVTNTSELQRTSAYETNQALQSIREDAFSQIRWANENAAFNLSCRIEELKLWRSKIAEDIAQVEQEISLLEQLKDFAEIWVEGNALEILYKCVMLRRDHMPCDHVSDTVGKQLNVEVQLCENVKPLIQQRIYQALQHLSALKHMHSQLIDDQSDKEKAIMLTDHCLVLEVDSPRVKEYKSAFTDKDVVQCQAWVEHCQLLRSRAENIILESSFFRSNLQHTISEFLNILVGECRATEFLFRKRLNELSSAKKALEWEKHQAMEAARDLQEEIENVENQILCSDSEEKYFQTRLDILEQRMKYALDRPYTCIWKDYQLMSKNTDNLKENLLLSKKMLEDMHNNLLYLEDNLKKNQSSIERELKCQELHNLLFELCSMPSFSIDLADTQTSLISDANSCSVESDANCLPVTYKSMERSEL